MATILCVDDEPAALLILRSALDAAGHRCIGVTNIDAAMNVVARGTVDLIISDYGLSDGTGVELLDRLRGAGHHVPVIMATGFGKIEQAVASMRAGALDYITKPIRPEQVALAVDQALEFARLRAENETLRSEVLQLRGERRIIGDSEAMRRIMQAIRTVAPTRTPVLVYGEPGTGKELLGRAIHDLSDRAAAPFIAVNCAALQDSLMESVLLGHERNAAAGPPRQSKGALERAHAGTLLLDEIAQLRTDLQGALLRVLQEQEFERAGGGAPVRVDVRILATTQRELADEVAAGRFLEDLYYRLSVVQVRIPPLRDRAADIPLLVQHFAQRAARQSGRSVESIESAALDRLAAHAWPGNVRELEHVVERAVILGSSGVLGADAFDLEQTSAVPRSDRRADGAPDAVVLDSLNIAEAERALISRALTVTKQNRTRAAELLGISVRTLRNKLNRELDAERA